MSHRKQSLGMNLKIKRRDFINGVGVAIGASMLPGAARGAAPKPGLASAAYPPSQSGMRGAHPGSFEAAHALVQGQQWQVGEPQEHYDLIVVGAGISGLSAAFIYLRDIKPDARILILDNHDDFGGHAKRNEFSIDGRTLIGYGGTMRMDSPDFYPAAAADVIKQLGIDASNYERYHHADLFAAHGMKPCSFFDEETFGADYLAAEAGLFKAGANSVPLSDASRAELARLFEGKENYLPGLSQEEQRAVLESHSWREYLKKFAGMSEESLRYVQKRPHGLWAIGADGMPAWLAWASDFPGFAGVNPGYPEEVFGAGEESYFHFPDGNATIARLLVRKLVPAVAPGQTMEDVITARFEYSALDQPANQTRLRLSSTVVAMKHRQGDLGQKVDMSYVNAGEAHAVSADKVIWAGYHAMVPYVCPDVPAQQESALRNSVRCPLVYTNVLIRNWQSLAKLGVSRAYCPGSFFQTVMMDYPVSIGDYQFSRSPDQPVLLHLQHIPTEPGKPVTEQFRSGRRQLLETPFAEFEHHARDQLQRMLGAGGFDAATDIKAITVNRWPHGYAYSTDSSSGDIAWWPEFWGHQERPWENSRQRIGNIAFANSDAASNAMTEAAIEEAHRAVHSL